ncbi:MAG: class I SAM-dependent methyltransferase, partial [Planctomycetaceae bacterium]|nr:class I SAM-dependent methyltransferase [Planctomycetaceae bacterium]
SPAAPVPSRPGFLDGILRRGVLRRLEGIREGFLVLRDAGGESAFGDPASTLRAGIRVARPSFWSAVALRGSVGAGESFMDGDWTADDLTAVVRILLRNRAVLDGMESGLARLGAPALRAFHSLRRNTLPGSRRNVADHYDLGNDLFALFLDRTMNYSALYFEREDATLEEAAEAKMDRLCRWLGLRPEHHLAEIGTGWGALALHAASRFGCRVTTTTLSGEQAAAARGRAAAAGLSGRIEVIERDYREMEGTFDRLVSVEMVEAVGADNLDGYFEACARLLRPGGLFALQAITIDHRLHGPALRRVDFIQRHVFPGSFIPSAPVLARSMERAGLRLERMEDIGPHYARTLREWRGRFLDNRDRVRALGYPERFLRMWEFYLRYCEGGFAEGVLGDAQILARRALP